MRELDRGRYCGQEPFAIDESVSAAALERMARLTQELRVTLYGARAQAVDDSIGGTGGFLGAGESGPGGCTAA